MKNTIEKTNQVLLDLVIQKVKAEYENDIDLIGVYGSCVTGDYHEKSDLDVLVVVNNERGYGFSRCFILNDIGYDLYGSTWSKLEDIASFDHTFTAELVDAEIVYYRNGESAERFKRLKQQALEVMKNPLTPEMLNKAKKHLDDAILAYGKMMLEDEIGVVRHASGEVIYCLANTISLLNRTYYKLGVKRQLEEILAMRLVPENYETNFHGFLLAETVTEIGEWTGKLIKSVKKLYQDIAEKTTSNPKPTRDNLRGTYEEIWSNLYNKVRYAAQHEDMFLAFSAGESCQGFYDHMHQTCGTSRIELMKHFDPKNLNNFADEFAKAMELYKTEYEKLGMKVQSYDSLEAFKEDYLG
ncbi:Nucleotidyltransferase domain-containing protein [Gracilibacillus ureilyticus]|uniref:Nucleotidyltransferase domain-containing protein n=1 Tax=Gracilibacillus ureilyticus TaxID=531814 RepID=A0A1H9W1E9_9BACI|nr:nucleotidyltransferase domain-containing protein [Gracilibacillus ureilyticus]SES27790.1 Nucleotidyltransferase domain-containing protein [Gracilibacillus ureilyticus]